MERDLKSLVKSAFETYNGSHKSFDALQYGIKKIIETGRFTEREVEQEVINCYMSIFSHSPFPVEKEDAIIFARSLIGIGIKKAEEISADLRNTSKKLPKKPFKLKEDGITLGKCLQDLSKKYGLIKEEFAFGIKVWNNWHSVYLIKSTKDKEDIERAAKGRNEVRFIAIAGTKDLYVFNPDISHEEVDSKLGVKPYNTDKPVIAGVAENRNGWKVTDSFNVFHGLEVARFTKNVKNTTYGLFIENILKADWSWMEQYIRISDFLKGVELQWQGR
jgi:hypothetical protein